MGKSNGARTDAGLAVDAVDEAEGCAARRRAERDGARIVLALESVDLKIAGVERERARLRNGAARNDFAAPVLDNKVSVERELSTLRSKRADSVLAVVDVRGTVLKVEL